ncbi:A24 family peptidase [Salinispora arenicola]|uniref:A24 family peptidase n=1 Tax=Salinispora arenicola TaxID=168697 RepID=UPI0016A48697|nr:A24 family peptidase [Salinispora arenicola]NIL56949.1 prepilin peptidase [Salinispora arenicola]NIL63053.1 prepilin peptidase [Salinispora arenicola]
MNTLTASGLGLAGALAGIPLSAIACSAPAHGHLHLPEGWWHGAPARPPTVAAVSLLTGTTTAVIGGLLPMSATLPAYWLFAVVGVGLAIIDIRRRRLPHVLTGTLMATCLISFIVATAVSGNPAPLLRAIIAGAITTTTLVIIALSLPGQLGLGDVTLAGAVTLSLGWLSWHSAALGIVSGLTLQGFVGLAARVRTGSSNTLPMGPALVAGWLLAVVLHAE